MEPESNKTPYVIEHDIRVGCVNVEVITIISIYSDVIRNIATNDC